MSLITPQQVSQFHELGYFVTEPMFDDATLKSMADEFDRVHDEQTRALEKRTDTDDLTRRITLFRPFIGQFHTRSPVAAAFVKAPIYLDACAAFIGPDADLYYNQAVIKPPEHGMNFAWHQDSGYTETVPLKYITCWTAISRTFVDNGCIWVIPGSHKLGLLSHPRSEEDNALHAQFTDEDKAIPVEMKPGQVAIFSSLTLHKSGPNVSKEIRRGYVPQYHVPGVVSVREGKPWGDQYPVLRGGKAV